MFMERIEVPAGVVAEPKPTGLKVAAGLLLIALSLIVMPPYLLALSAWVAVAGAYRFLCGACAAAYSVILYAGETVTGR